MNITLISILLGAGIPVLVHLATFFFIRRTVVGDPLKMMKANIVGFLARMVLYAVIVVLVISSVKLKATPFVFSFLLIFVLLHLAEATYFQRLFSSSNSSE